MPDPTKQTCAHCGNEAWYYKDVEGAAGGMPDADLRARLKTLVARWEAQQVSAKLRDLLASTPTVKPWRLVLDLIGAARRVRAKYGARDDGTPMDWTEWTDLDAACSALESAYPSHIPTCAVALNGRHECSCGKADHPWSRVVRFVNQPEPPEVKAALDAKEQTPPKCEDCRWMSTHIINILDRCLFAGRRYWFCRMERNIGHCGPSGKLFQAKEDKRER